MKILLGKKRELKDGPHLSKITGFRDVPKRNSCVTDFTVFDEEGEFEDTASLWIKSICYEGTVEHRLFEILGVSDEEELDTDSLNSEFQNFYIGIVVKNNEKNGQVYHNIIDFFEVDTEDGEADEDEEYNEDNELDEDEEEYEEEDSDSEEDNKLEEEEEDLDDDEEESEESENDDDDEDDFEDFVRPTSRRSGSITIPRREEKPRKSNRR